MSETIVCAVCGRPIERHERRFADFNRDTKAMRQVHLGCMTEGQMMPARSPNLLHRLSRAVRRALSIRPRQAVHARS